MASLAPPCAPGSWRSSNTSASSLLPPPRRRLVQRQTKHHPRPKCSVLTVASPCFSSALCLPLSVVPHEHTALPPFSFSSPAADHLPEQPALACLDSGFLLSVALHPNQFSCTIILSLP